jgi:hypothetical protein
MKPRRAGLKLQVVAPCNEDWDQMAGGDDIRFCGRCRQNVYNLSEMNQTQVRELVQGPACVRFFARGDGTVVTKECSGMLEAARRRVVALAAGLLPLAAGFWGSVAWLRAQVHGRPPMVMGGIPAMPPPPPPMMGTPAPRPMMGEPAPLPEPEHVPPKRLMGKPVRPALQGRAAAPPPKKTK